MESRQGKLNPKKPATSIRTGFLSPAQLSRARSNFRFPRIHLGQQTVVLYHKRNVYISILCPKSRKLHTPNCNTANPRSYKIKAYQYDD